MSGVGKNRFDQTRMVENGIARFGVAQKIDQRNTVVARACQSADNEIEIRGGEPCPTICPNHRAFRSRALTMPQPSLFEVRCISERQISQALWQTAVVISKKETPNGRSRTEVCIRRWMLDVQRSMFSSAKGRVAESGLRHSTRNRAWGNPPWVRIPPLPPR